MHVCKLINTTMICKTLTMHTVKKVLFSSITEEYEQTNEWMNKYIKIMNEYSNEWMSEWLSEWMNDMNEWVSEWC